MGYGGDIGASHRENERMRKLLTNGLTSVMYYREHTNFNNWGRTAGQTQTHTSTCFAGFSASRRQVPRTMMSEDDTINRQKREIKKPNRKEYTCSKACKYRQGAPDGPPSEE